MSPVRASSGDDCATATAEVLPSGILLPYYGYREIGALACVCKAWRDQLLGSDVAWRAVCLALAEDARLYCPGVYTPGWRRLFWEHLLPAKGKWAGDEDKDPQREGDAGFKIQVAVRFRPGRAGAGRSRGGFLLPLHQRLQLLGRGQKVSREEADGAGLSGDSVATLLAAGGDVGPEVLQALLEAEALARLASVAEHDARDERQRPQWVGVGEDFDGDEAGGDGERGGDEGGSGARGNAATAGAVSASMRSWNLLENNPEDEEQEGEEEVHATVHRKGGSACLLAVQPSRVTMYVPGVGLRPFRFGDVHDGGAEQSEVYSRSAHDAIIAALNGFNACLLCYGQTGSGKTHTCFGPQGVLDATRTATLTDLPLPSTAGVVLRAVQEVLHATHGTGRAHHDVASRVSVQYVEIYQEKLTDLVSGNSVGLRDAGPAAFPQQFVLQGAEEIEIESMEHALSVLMTGEARKRYAATGMNHRSSRAHTIFIVSLLQADRDGTLVRSQLHLVDLAGSEQLKQSRAEGQRRAEAVGINSSLLVLGKVISALVKGRSHVPYYESRLTQLLRSALGGNSRTHCLVTASMDHQHADQTLQALRFGEQCSHITNRTRQAATSLPAALEAIDAALDNCQAGMSGLAARGKSHLPSYCKLEQRFRQLTSKRAALVAQQAAAVCGS